MKRRIIITEEELYEVYNRYLDGETIAKISNSKPYGEDLLAKRLREAGYELSNKVVRGDNRYNEIIYQRYVEGESVVEISKDYKTHWSQIYRNLVKAGYDMKFRRSGYGVDKEEYILEHYGYKQNKQIAQD